MIAILSFLLKFCKSSTQWWRVSYTDVWHITDRSNSRFNIPLLLFHCKRVDITDLYYLVRPTFAEDQMSLFPEENVLTKEIESWKAFADSLKTDEEKKLFVEMLGKCQKYALAINAKGEPFPAESLIMALLLEQHKMINWLQNKIPIRKQRFFKCS